MHRLILHNDTIRDAAETVTSPGQVGLLNGWGVFSTLRVTEGVLFAFERHWERMQRDARLLHVPFPADAEWLRTRLFRLIEANHAANATLRVVVVRNHGGPYDALNIGGDFDLIAFTTDFAAWPESVKLGLKPDARHARSEFAGTKVLSWAFNLTWHEEAHDLGFDEFVLLNERGEVSECTSANIFAIEGSNVWTPPLSSGCLPGVTRALLLEEVHVPGLAIAEKTLMPADLERMDQLFITSSTRDVLPVSAIEKVKLQQTGLERVAQLKQALVTYRDHYVAARMVTVASL